MSAPWTAWKRILSGKQKTESPPALHEPNMNGEGCIISSQASAITRLSSKNFQSTRNNPGSCCPRSYSNLRDVIHHGLRVMHKSDSDSPHLGSSLCGSSGYLHYLSQSEFSPDSEITNTWCSGAPKAIQLRKLSGCYDCSMACEPPEVFLSHCNSSSRSAFGGFCQTVCHKCGESFNKMEILEQHCAIHHTVSEVREGDSSRNIVEIIFQSSWLKEDIPCGRIERIMKVHNNASTVTKFEEYRETVKAKATKFPKKYSRCIADGNELLRFYCTFVSCALGMMGSSSALCCTLSACSLCQILRYGFTTKNQLGIYTTASSGKAHDSASALLDEGVGGKEKRAMLVCRVIAGRMKKIFQGEVEDSTGFDSVGGERGVYANVEDLVVFNPKAILPCFVVIYSYQ